MKMEIIKKGDIINTVEGFLVVNGFNGHIVTVQEHTMDYAENEDGSLNYDDSIEKVKKRYLTLNEIALMMRENDGFNHKVVWEG